MRKLLQAISDVIRVLSGTQFMRAIYAGNALQTVTSSNAVHVLSVRSTAFPAATPAAQPAASIEMGIAKASANRIACDNQLIASCFSLIL